MQETYIFLNFGLIWKGQMYMSSEYHNEGELMQMRNSYISYNLERKMYCLSSLLLFCCEKHIMELYCSCKWIIFLTNKSKLLKIKENFIFM